MGLGYDLAPKSSNKTINPKEFEALESVFATAASRSFVDVVNRGRHWRATIRCNMLLQRFFPRETDSACFALVGFLARV